MEWGAELYALKDAGFNTDRRGYHNDVADQLAAVLDEWYAAATGRAEAGVDHDLAMKEVNQTVDVLLPLIAEASSNWEAVAIAAHRIDKITGNDRLAYVAIAQDRSHVVRVDYVRLAGWAAANPASLHELADSLDHLFDTCHDITRKCRPLKSAYHAASKPPHT